MGKRIIINYKNVRNGLNFFLIFIFLLSRLNPFISEASAFFWLPLLYAILLLVIFLSFRIRSDAKFSLDYYILWLFFCSIYAFLTKIWANNSNDVDYIAVTMLENLWVFLTIYLYVSNKQDFDYALHAYFLAVKINAVCYLLTFFLNENAEGRLGGEINANTVGFIMAFSIWLIIFYRIDNQKKKIDIVSGLWIFLFLLNLILSGSKKAIIMLILLLLIRQLLKNKNAAFVLVKYLLLIIAILIFLRIIPFLYNSIGYRIWDMIEFFVSQNSQNDYSTFQRFEMIRIGIHFFLDKPILGYGINNYHILSYAYFQRSWFDTYSHCNYIETLVSGGIVFFALYYSIYFRYIKKGKNQSNNKLFIYPLIITLFIIEIGMVTYYTSYCQLLICLSACYIKANSKR